MKRISDHKPLDDMPTVDEIDRIMDFCETLGLHGVLLLAKPCRACGQLHNFAIASDLDADEDVPHVLARYAAATANTKPVRKGRPSKPN